MNDNNLLVITNSYPNHENSFVGGIFVKDQVNELKKYFNNIYVISPLAYGIQALRKTKFQDYSYDNVSVFFPRYLNIPLFWFVGRSFWLIIEERAIIALIKKQRIDFSIIHSHFTWPSGSVAVRIKKKYSVPLIITEHSSETFNQAIYKKDRFFINAWVEADRIIRVRKNDIIKFIQVGISADKVIAIPNGFNTRIFRSIDPMECRKKLNLPFDKKIILNVGNLYSEVKGHKYLIDAISIISKENKKFICIIVGSGSLRKKLEKDSTSRGLNDFIKFVGSVKHDEIPLWINACDVFVLPSLNEGNPTVMFEALGCGKPFIGTRVGGVPEVITSEDYGLLVEPANSEDLAEKILISLNREWDQKKILDHAGQFTWDSIAKQIIDVYKQVLKENPE